MFLKKNWKKKKWKGDNNVYCVKKSAIAFINERRGLKKLNYASNDEEICLQIDKNLQTLSVNYEISSFSNQQMDSLAQKNLIIQTPPTIGNYQVIIIKLSIIFQN